MASTSPSGITYHFHGMQHLGMRIRKVHGCNMLPVESCKSSMAVVSPSGITIVHGMQHLPVESEKFMAATFPTLAITYRFHGMQHLPVECDRKFLAATSPSGITKVHGCNISQWDHKSSWLQHLPVESQNFMAATSPSGITKVHGCNISQSNHKSSWLQHLPVESQKFMAATSPSGITKVYIPFSPCKLGMRQKSSKCSISSVRSVVLLELHRSTWKS